MLNLDFVCFGVLRAVELCSVRFHLMKLWKNFHRKIGRWGEPRFGWLGIQNVIMTLPPSWGDKMSMLKKKGKKRKTHWREGWTSQTTARQRLNVAVAWCLPGGMYPTTLANCCSADTSWTCRGCTMHNEGPEGPHGESSATCVQWCGWGSCSCRGCLQRAQLAWWIKPDCTNCCYEAPSSAGAGSLGHLLSPFHLLQPSVICNPVLGPSSYLPRSTFSAAQSASTMFLLGCCSIYTLTSLSSDFG